MHKKHKMGKYEKISRALTQILRHAAIQEGIKIQSNGFVLLDDIMDYLAGKGYQNLTLDIIQEIVNTNDKKRFELKQENGVKYIRATQGHSIKEVNTNDLLAKIQDLTEYPIVIHGTYLKFWEAIKKEGLKRMNRNHIHFAPGFPKDKGVISGMRTSCEIYIQIDMQTAMKQGIDFYISANKVILTQGKQGVLSVQYFKKVISKNGQLLMLKDQEEDDDDNFI